MEIKDFLRARLEQLDLSLSDLEKRLNLKGYKVTKATIGHWVSGRNKPPLKDRQFVEILSLALEMTVSEMMEQMDFIVSPEHRSTAANRVADMVDRLPPDKQDLALRLVEQLMQS